MSNETLALGVIFFSFVIFGACLWVSVTYLVVATDKTATSEQRQSADRSCKGAGPTHPMRAGWR